MNFNLKKKKQYNDRKQVLHLVCMNQNFPLNSSWWCREKKIKEDAHTNNFDSSFQSICIVFQHDFPAVGMKHQQPFVLKLSPHMGYEIFS